MSIRGEHNIEAISEVMSYAHAAFYEQLCTHKVSGMEIINNYPF